MVRVKRRYFVFQIRFDSNSSKTIKNSQIHLTFEAEISRLYGDFGAARFIRNLSIIYYNSSTHLTIVRCLRDDKHLLQTTATFLKRIIDDFDQCSFQTLHVSGSIRQAKKFLVNYSIEQLLFIEQQRKQNQQEETSTILFGKKKKKHFFAQQQSKNQIDQEKQKAFQKLLAHSRIESISNIELKNDQNSSVEKMKIDEE